MSALPNLAPQKTLRVRDFYCWGGSSAKQPPFDYRAVRRDLGDLLSDDLSVGPILVRLAWHEAGTWDKSKKDGGPNTASMRFAPHRNLWPPFYLMASSLRLHPISAYFPRRFTDSGFLPWCGEPLVKRQVGQKTLLRKERKFDVERTESTAEKKMMYRRKCQVLAAYKI